MRGSPAAPTPSSSRRFPTTSRAWRGAFASATRAADDSASWSWRRAPVRKAGRSSVLAEASLGLPERLGGAGIVVANELEALTGKQARYVVLGHLQRGGVPTSFDRTLATRFGGKAVELVRKGRFGLMVANHPPDLVPIPLGDVVGRTKTVPLDNDLLLTARALGMSFGD